jgi:hypothetical protein
MTTRNDQQDNESPSSDFGTANELYNIAMAVGIPETVAMHVVDYTLGVIHYLDGTEWVDPQGIVHSGVLHFRPDDDRPAPRIHPPPRDDDPGAF